MLSGGSTLQVTGSVLLAGSNGGKNSVLDLSGMVVEAHVSQHHDGREQQSGGVSKTLTGNIGGRTVNGLKDRNLITHVTRGGQTKTTNQTRGKVRKNITVKVGHDHDVVLVRSRVSDETETGGVNKLGLKGKVGVLLGQLLGSGKEQTIGNLHDRGLVDSKNLGLVDRTGVLKGVSENSLGSLLGDELDGLDNTGNNNVLDTRVLTLSVLSDQDSVDTIVGGLVTNDRLAGTDVGEEVESSSKSQVKGDVTLTNGGSKGTLKSNQVLADRVDSNLGDGGLAIDKNGGDVNRLPLNGDLSSLVDILDSL